MSRWRALRLAAWLCWGPSSALAGPLPLAAAVEAPEAREAIARVAYAEARGQGDAGLAGVVFTILNRAQSGAWGEGIEAVVNARGQFEPVMRAGGDWRGLRPVTPAERARIDTILNLALEGRLPDPTGGARYFQNPAIVAERVQAGAASPGLVHFGGARPSAVIGDHAFYVSTGAHAERSASERSSAEARAGAGGIFVQPWGALIPSEETPAGERGVFVLPDGRVVVELPSAP